jgi:hypothetical protein
MLEMRNDVAFLVLMLRAHGCMGVALTAAVYLLYCQRERRLGRGAARAPCDIGEERLCRWAREA